ncbi:L,D-transpeptidase [Corynebacterium halotolerans]|uniref:L,D-TPase catalytic domain-containing protein n=1 Tax=Corynebacterium halotolerans YIM 70093 = DSM 44683 TaxID=1121362 RepID=M1NVN2_9CORY|nr:L,D-transpeptidase [Corynebacterium halotolerans]AGF71550.1 hypothetical protein A605_02680 [Corynebacterium halotolerans YIM 70093 = DSM 44683]
MQFTPRTVMSAFTRRGTALIAAAAASIALIAAPVAASAAPVLPAGSSSPEEVVTSVETGLRDTVWDTRTTLHQQADVLPPQAADIFRGAVDDAVEGVFPGLVAERSPAPEPDPVPVVATAPAAEPAPAAKPGFDFGSCPPAARACVDLDGRRTWLQRDGVVTHGAVHMAPGKPGQETPSGTFYVNRKVKDEISYEFNNAPMPYAVYFTYNGHAFHQGDPAYLSAGCIRLNHDDAVKYFNELQIGDMVYIY